jgi:hypothetical protein
MVKAMGGSMHWFSEGTLKRCWINNCNAFAVEELLGLCANCVERLRHETCDDRATRLDP